MAGVSTATVSRALSKPALVSAEALEAVRAAVEQTGYTVNQAARNLRQQRTMGVVALVPNLANPFFARILAGMSAVLAPAGYNLLVVDTQGPGADPHIARKLDRSRADGLIVFDGTVPPGDLSGDALAPPVVLACEWIDGIAAPVVRIDNFEGARMAVRHLIGLGHRRIGYLGGPAANLLARARAAGVRAELAAGGLPMRADWALDGAFSLETGQHAARAWMAMSDRPEALFCASDEIACGFIGEIQRHGFRVPGHVSVIGFDDIELVAHITPALTTIRQPRGTIGETAARVMMALVAGEAPPADDIVLPVELIERDSTAPPRRP